MRSSRLNEGLVLLLMAVAAGTDVMASAWVTDCGVLVQDSDHDCVLFKPVGSGSYVLADYQGYGVGDTIFVSGPVDSTCTSPCLGTYPCIQNYEACPCSHRDLGCGRLWLDPAEGCQYFYSPEYPGVDLSTRGTYASGDSVRVAGWYWCGHESFCFYFGYLRVEDHSVRNGGGQQAPVVGEAPGAIPTNRGGSVA